MSNLDRSLLKQFVSPSQLSFLDSPEINPLFQDLQNIIKAMPKPYESESQAAPMASLHYFHGDWDWYVIETDEPGEQKQCFGLVKGFEVELGYFSIADLIKSGVEVDLHFKPMPVDALQQQLRQGV